jgi:hypothetical protein
LWLCSYSSELAALGVANPSAEVKVEHGHPQYQQVGGFASLHIFLPEAFIGMLISKRIFRRDLKVI